MRREGWSCERIWEPTEAVSTSGLIQAQGSLVGFANILGIGSGTSRRLAPTRLRVERWRREEESAGVGS